ncbi:PREDICTED: protein POOR HOMOLOGOUS SYNAPSIS 1 [Nicotiana attenuata]|uniref:protein POOR HOMOLOGOUS SYNAPSIS 1 n=1 Tax=Nicotiana attenuata TaxID=49451 RepID=UPI00090552D4|nr:PREDICTED: protein POOR HOMOLOGOUS SYNAPSIS 1 [Nicotiana attenuata]
MAGSHSLSWPATAAAEQSELPPSSMSIATVTNQWEAEYARFILYPPASPHPSHPSLVPLRRKHCTSGKWISSSSLVSLKLRTDRSDPNRGFILILAFHHTILEEHYVSRLMFSWPQVSCVSGFPTRGTRAVFVSYRDSVGQIQKFVLRFLTIYEIENFMNVLKGRLDSASPPALPCLEFDSVISSQSEFIPFGGASQRDNEGWIYTASGDSSSHHMPVTWAPGFSQGSHTEEMRLNREAEEILSAFPPSFTSFLMNCGPEADQVAAQSSTTKEVDLKDQIAKYLEDSSFQDMLVKVEEVIRELGDNTVL